MAKNAGSSDSSGALKLEAEERIFRLLQFILANECTRKDIFKHLALYYKIDEEAISENAIPRRVDRMFERDIGFLEDQGFEIKKVKGGSKPTFYSLVKGSGPRTTYLFTRSEVDGLALLYNIFADPTRYAQADASRPLPQSSSHSPFTEEVHALIEKLISTLPQEHREYFINRVHKPYLYFNLSTVTDYLPYRATIESTIQAILSHQQIRFEYKPMHREQDVIVHEHIDPYYIIHMDGHFYLIAYSHKMDQFFEYRVDRIKGESLALEHEPIDVERRRHPIEFRFWIDGNIAKRGLSQRWLTQMQEREEVYLDEHGREQRRVLVRATAYNEWRVIQQMLKYGAKAELIEPPYLREKLRQEVARMHHLYEK